MPARASRAEAAGNSPSPGRTARGCGFPGSRRRSFRWTWRMRWPRRRTPSTGSSPASKAFGASQRTPTPSPGTSSRRESMAAAGAKSPCDSTQTSTPAGRAFSRRASRESAMKRRVDARSVPGWTASPKTRTPGAPSSSARPTTRSASAREAERVVALAHEQGAPGVRVFGDAVQPGTDLASTRRFIADSLLALREKARPAGVEVWVESHGDFAPAAAMLSLLELVPGDGVGVLWDAPNAFEAGDDPVEGVRRLGHRIRHVHLKDLRREPGKPHPRAVLPGEGEFPAASALEALAGIGYRGWLSFEWEKKWQPEIEDPEVALPRFIAWAPPLLRGAQGSRPLASGTPAETVRTFSCARLAVEVHPGRPSLGRAAARLVAAHLRDEVARRGRAAVVFASAPSQNEFLAALRADPDVPWTKLTAFHLDEYVGVGSDHPASFRRFLTDRLLAHVPVGAFHGLDGKAKVLAAECDRYADLLRRAAPSLAILGIGENGHLAFIDPPMCDFHDPADVRVVELDEP